MLSGEEAENGGRSLQTQRPFYSDLPLLQIRESWWLERLVLLSAGYTMGRSGDPVFELTRIG
jgi:hypothetical protein